MAKLWQDTSNEPINVALTYNSTLGQYTGNTVLDKTYDARGRVQVQATGTQGNVWRQQAFAILSVDAQKDRHLYSQDGNFEVVLPEGALAEDAFFALQPATISSTTQTQRVQLGLAYQVIISTGQYQTNAPVVINMRFADLEPGVPAESLHVYRWDNVQQRWLRAGISSVDVTKNIISTSVSQLGTFALMSVSGADNFLYLPVLMK